MSRLRWLYVLVFHNSVFLVCIAATLFQPLSVLAYDLNASVVTEDKGIFHIKISAIIEAPAEQIRQALSDYTHIYRLSPSIIESEVLPSSKKGEKKVKTKLLFCNSVFCRKVERVDIVRTLPSGNLQAEIVPELSDFQSGLAEWKIIPMGDRSGLVYEANIEPDFYIPPFVGTFFVKNSLEDEFINTFDRVEIIASFNAKRDLNEEYSREKVVLDKTKQPCNKKLSACL
ncbi:MAG: hypothetical protein WBO93_01460 [Gammaproteobacteria bacterium]